MSVLTLEGYGLTARHILLDASRNCYTSASHRHKNVSSVGTAGEGGQLLTLGITSCTHHTGISVQPLVSACPLCRALCVATLIRWHGV